MLVWRSHEFKKTLKAFKRFATDQKNNKNGLDLLPKANMYKIKWIKAFIITQINLRADEFLVHFFKRVRKSLQDWQMQPHLKPHSVPPGLE